MPTPPLISFVIAARDASQTVGQAVGSALGQSVGPLEVVVVDDGSLDDTAELVAAFGDERIRLIRNDRPTGLAAALNRGIEAAEGRWIARLDADDVALPRRLELQLARARRGDVGIVGGAALAIDEHGRPGALHRMPSGRVAVRWRALFAPPFFHPAVLLDRALLERHGLGYDPRFERTQDYDLWNRVLSVVEGDNIGEPVVLYRSHPAQVSHVDAGAQRDRQREIGIRSILEVAPALGHDGAGLAWSLGSGNGVPDGDLPAAVDAFRELLHAFARAHRGDAGLRAARRDAGRALLRAALRARSDGSDAFAAALRSAPSLPIVVPVERVRRRRATREARDEARRTLARLGPDGRSGPVRVTVVSPEPTPFRSIHFDRLAARPEIALSVVYSGRTIFGRTWTIEHRHRAMFLRGIRVPGVRNVLRHDYPITLGVFRALAADRPDVVVVSGWSTFASQAALAWCRLRRVPYVLLVESNDADARPGWRRVVKGLVVPRFTRKAARVLVIGELARRSMTARGVPAERIAWFANTIDVVEWGDRADRLQERRAELRAALGAGDEDVVVLSVARLAPEKGLDRLVEAVGRAADPRLLVVVVGEGPERAALADLASRHGVRLELVGNVEFDRVIEAYVAADVFALLSTHEPWGVVVNEAAACGLPLLLSHRVGAAADLLLDGENGVLVASDDVQGAADAIRRLLDDADWRESAGRRSRELIRGWGYEPSSDNFVAAVREAAVR